MRHRKNTSWNSYFRLSVMLWNIFHIFLPKDFKGVIRDKAHILCIDAFFPPPLSVCFPLFPRLDLRNCPVGMTLLPNSISKSIFKVYENSPACIFKWIYVTVTFIKTAWPTSPRDSGEKHVQLYRRLKCPFDTCKECDKTTRHSISGFSKPKNNNSNSTSVLLFFARKKYWLVFIVQ